MRMLFPDPSRPKMAAKLLSRVAPEVKVSDALAAVARATGYRNWNDLQGAGGSAAGHGVAGFNEARHVVLAIADRLPIAHSDVQYAVAKSRLLRSGAWTLAEHLQLCAAVWRERVFGPPAWGKPGSVIKVRAHGRTLPAYLRLQGRPSYVLYDTGPGMCADFEVVTPRVPQDDFVPARLWLPYGYWTLRDGSEVIFARDYLPMWRVSDAGVERLDPWLWIEGISKTTVFSEVLGTVIWERDRARDAALAHLASRRIFELPRLVEAMADLIAGGAESLGPSVARMKERIAPTAQLPSFARVNPHLVYA